VVTVVCVDNGEPNLEWSIKSLRDQTVSANIVIAAGPKTNIELAKSLADYVVGPISGIGRARVTAILKYGDDVIVSCDSDTIYDPRYIEYALNDLVYTNSVRAGTIYPLNPSVEGWFEALMTPFIPYEYALAFKKQYLLSRLPRNWESLGSRWDIGWLLLPYAIDTRMRLWTRLPTYGGTIAINTAKLGIVATLSALPFIVK
jgi:glycosyltransferase involved in cell wall biosynthesis